MVESATLERLRRLAADGAPRQAGATAPDAWRRAGLARGQLHELYAAEPDDAGAALGAAVALALAAGALPLLWLRLGTGRDRGGPSASGALELGLAPPQLLLGLAPDTQALLRAGSDAARCAGLGTVLIEAWGPWPALDLTATRRLMLAAEGSGVTVLALRLAATPVPSAAATRWSVAARPSTAFDAGAPGLPAFAIECLRRRDGPAGGRWHVEWNRDTQCFDDPGPWPIGHAGQPGAPLSGAGLPLAAGRAAARDAPASVRRAG